MARRNHDEGLDIPASGIGVGKLLQSVDEHVDSLVAVLVPSTYSDQDGVLRDLLTRHGGGYFDKSLAGAFALLDE